jgi:hypothetical protein
MKAWFSFIDSSAGGVAVIFSLALLPILGATGAALDYSRATANRASLQNAADSAALAGAAAPAGQKIQTAQAVFDANVRGISAISARATITLPDAQRVSVAANGTMAVSIFKALSPSGVDLSVRSIALRAQSSVASSGCFYILDPGTNGALRVNGGSRVVAPRCDIHVQSSVSDSFILNSSTTLDVRRVCVRGTAIVRGTTGLVEQGCNADRDPYAGTLPPVAVGGCTFNNQTYNAGPAVINLTPGVYCGWTNINGSPTINLAPGLYVIKDGGMNINSGSVLRGSGVTFYFTGANAGLTMNGQMQMYLDAPTTGTYANILMFQNPTLPSRNFIFNNELGQKLSGLIWLPTQDIQFNSKSNGTDSDTVAVVAKTAILNAQAQWNVTPRTTTVTTTASGPAYLER